MGKSIEQQTLTLPKEDTVGNCAKLTRKDTEKIHLNYTNRRKIKEELNDYSKNNMERKVENEKDFDDICLRLKECSISKGSEKTKKVSSRTSSVESSSVSTSCGSESKVEEFRRFVQLHGGHYGGWKVKDHLFFLKVRNKCPLNKTAEVVHENYPDISIERILEHDAWYSQYLRLRSANKIAIEEWKKTQKSIKEEHKKIPDPQPKNAIIKRDPNIREKIEIWRAKTLATTLEKLEEHRQKELIKKKEEENKRKIQEARKALVNQYLKEKISCEMAMKAAEEVESAQEKREAAQRTASLLKYFRYEDRKFSERQKSKRKQEVKEVPKRKPLIQVKRDPSRLLRPTQGWIYRTKKNEFDGTPASSTKPLDINHLHKLGKPAWRKSIIS